MGDPIQLSPQLDAAISLPGSLFELIDDNANTSVLFVQYDVPTLFPVDGGNNVNNIGMTQTKVGSQILAATVGIGLNFQNLEEHRNVVVVFRLQVNEERVK